MKTEIKINQDNNDLWCIYSKARIEVGEKYVVIIEKYQKETIEKTYKSEYAPTQDELEDDVVILPGEN